MQIVYIELEKTATFLKKLPEELTNAEEWGVFLRYASYDDKREVLEKIAKKNRGISMAVNVLNYISKDTLERMKYESEILAEIDRQAEIDYVIKEEKIKLVKKMLAKNKPIDEIIELTDLTKEEILEVEYE